MRSEDLIISLDEVRVRYEFDNMSDHDVTTLVAFPMPDLKGDSDYNVSVPVEDAENFLAFETTVDGKPVETKVEQRASALGVDQTARLKRARRAACSANPGDARRARSPSGGGMGHAH